jgi:ubiquinone/menaquinone biosynthesis C-methylase UbiE
LNHALLANLGSYYFREGNDAERKNGGTLLMDKKAFFNEQAVNWDRHFYTPEMQERLSRLVSLFHLRPASRLLDVGGGTGGIIPHLLQAVGPQGKIWSIDFAEKMVEIARKKFNSEPRVRFQLASVETLPFDPDMFDQVICFGAFPHFTDQEQALREMYRVLRKGGTLIIAHALSSEEIKAHHRGASPVRHDFLSEEKKMKILLADTGFEMLRLIDQPKCYLCEGNKTA